MHLDRGNPWPARGGKITSQKKHLWKGLLFIATVLLGGSYVYTQHMAPFARDYLLLTEKAGFTGWISILIFLLSLPFVERKTFHLRSVPRYSIGIFFFYYFLLTYDPFVAPLLKSKLGLQDGVSDVIFSTVPAAVLFVTFLHFDFLLASAGGGKKIALRVSGAALAAAGIFLFVGNRTGAYTTFSFAGTILMLLGVALLVIGLEQI